MKLPTRRENIINMSVGLAVGTILGVIVSIRFSSAPQLSVIDKVLMIAMLWTPMLILFRIFICYCVNSNDS